MARISLLLFVEYGPLSNRPPAKYGQDFAVLDEDLRQLGPHRGVRRQIHERVDELLDHMVNAHKPLPKEKI